MKTKLFGLIFILLIGFSCKDQTDPIIFNGPQFVFFELSSSNLSVLENSTEPISVPVKVSLAQKTDINVKLEISAENAVAGSDYQILTASPLIIKSGEYVANFKLQTIDNSVIESPTQRRYVTVKIVSADALQVQVLGEVKIEILNDDCPFVFDDFVGEYDMEFNSEAGFLWDAGKYCCESTSLTKGSIPNTLVDKNFYGLATSGFPTINDAVSILFNATGTSISLNPSPQLAYINGAGAARNYEQDATVGPGSVLATCKPTFTVNFIIRRNTGTVAEIATVKYTKK
jgi:hypothetical protein